MLALFTVSGVPQRTVLVTGATGRTGSILFNLLRQQHNATLTVRGLTRNKTKAQQILNCGQCDEAEGIFVGDVTVPSTLVRPMDGIDALVILSSSAPHVLPNGSWVYPPGGTPREVDFLGGNAQVLAALASGTCTQILLVSSMGTTEPDSYLDRVRSWVVVMHGAACGVSPCYAGACRPWHWRLCAKRAVYSQAKRLPLWPSVQMGNGHALFYKLNQEAFLMGAAAAARPNPTAFTVVKPGGLTNDAGGNSTLLVGHEDSIQDTVMIARADVAAVLTAALLQASVLFATCMVGLRRLPSPPRSPPQPGIHHANPAPPSAPSPPRRLVATAGARCKCALRPL